jgi:hypothetical protein
VPDSRPTATGSRRRDLAVFALLALAIAVGSQRLAVYYTLRVVRVEVERVRGDGSRERLPTPARFQRPGSDLAAIARRIDRYMERDAPAAWSEPGTSIDWVVRWSVDSLKLHESRTLRFEGGAP